MRSLSLLVLATTASTLLACGSSPPEAQSPAGDATATPSAATVTATPPAPKAEPSAEEQKKAAAAKQLEEDRAALEAAHKAELARWTPEMRTDVKALMDKTFPSAKAAVQAAMAGKHRRPASAARDKDRHPAETLEFLGLKPTMNVIEYGPGDGWYTELIAPTVAKKGKLFGTNGDPNGPVEERSTYYAQRFKLFLDGAPDAYGKVEPILVDGKAPALPRSGDVDLILVFRGLHGMVNAGTVDAWLAAFHKALKPGGVLGIEQHRANAGDDPAAASKKGYLPEAWVIEKIKASGFELAAKSEINANAKDTKDYPDGVWSLPPTLRGGDKDKDKYVGIGESDRMTLRFVKSKAAPKADAAKK